MGCVIVACEKEKTHARDLCRAHYMQDIRGTLGLSQGRVNTDDGVRTPADLPILPKAVIDGIDTQFSGDKGSMWAVIMPYPSLDGTQPCAQLDTYWYDPDLDESSLSGSERNLRQQKCNDCPFLVPCREWAVAHEQYGYWGGMNAHQREQRRTARRQRLVSPQYAGRIGFPDRWDEREHEREIAMQAATLDPEVEVEQWLHA